MANTPSPGITLTLPEDQQLLAWLGAVALRHSHLDNVLKMLYGALLGLTPDQTREVTKREGSKKLRGRVRTAAEQRLVNHPNALKDVLDFLPLCESVTAQRNDYVHSVWAHEIDGDPVMLREIGTPGPLPTVEQLITLHNEIEVTIINLHQTRFRGTLAVALHESRPHPRS